MSTHEPLARLPSDAYHAVPAVALDPDFDRRWAAWIARGQAHEKIVRRKVGVFAGLAAIAAAMLYTFLR